VWRWSRQGDSVAGVDQHGAQVVRVPIREPVYVRAAFDAKYQVARVNCP